MKDKFIIIIIIIAILCITIASCSLRNGNERTGVYTVTDKGIKNYDKESLYLIYTKNHDGEVEVLCIEDTLVHGRWNSSDLYARIEVGKTYKFTICGTRIPFFSMYPNILELELIK